MDFINFCFFPKLSWHPNKYSWSLHVSVLSILSITISVVFWNYVFYFIFMEFSRHFNWEVRAKVWFDHFSIKQKYCYFWEIYILPPLIGGRNFMGLFFSQSFRNWSSYRLKGRSFLYGFIIYFSFLYYLFSINYSCNFFNLFLTIFKFFFIYIKFFQIFSKDFRYFNFIIFF